MSQKDKDFQKLKAIWDKKLAKEGLEDIEQPNGMLKKWAGAFFKDRHKRFGSVSFEAKEEYYRLAGQFLHSYPFETETERKVWELHSEGMSIREIVRTLGSKRIKTYKDKVFAVIKRLTAEMFRQNNI